MNIIKKSRKDLDMMRAAGRVAFRAIQRVREQLHPGITTAEVDRLMGEIFKASGAVSTSKWYPSYTPGRGFPGETCVSVNEEVVHGIPGPKVLHEGDIVTADCAIKLNGYFIDTAFTFPVGTVKPEVLKMLQVSQDALDIAIKAIRPSIRWSDVAAKIQKHIESHGYSLVKDFVGHGIGTKMHEDPKVPNYVESKFLRKGDFFLEPGMTIAVEPMVIMGDAATVTLDDGWTIVTKDGSPSCHFEHTIAVTASGSDVLTDGR